jgi:hypothetical protein
LRISHVPGCLFSSLSSFDVDPPTQRKNPRQIAQLSIASPFSLMSDFRSHFNL